MAKSLVIVRVVIVLIANLLALSAIAQIAFLDHNDYTSRTIDRTTTLHSVFDYHSAVRYGDRMHILSLYQKMDSTVHLSTFNRMDWDHIISDIPERYRFGSEFEPVAEAPNPRNGLLRLFYKSSHHFLLIDEEDFFLKVDPVFNFKVGHDAANDDFIFQNTRGVKVRGTIDDKIYFFTSIFENQRDFLQYQDKEISRINAIPGEGFYKPFQSSLIDAVNGLDYLNTQAYVGAKLSKSIDLQLGHGRHFIGEGMRSLLLSDYSNNYFYLKLSTQVWKIHYQNLFTQLDAISSRDNVGDELLPRKYMAAHFLNFEISKRLTIGLYEAVVLGREDGFELQYLNPIILYRSLERQLDSPDNVLLGLNYKWIPKDGIQLYGQLVVDELKTSEVFSNNGWWGNKVGYQVGLKKFNLFNVDQLDLQLEYNTVRPFTYGHRADELGGIPVASYSHQNQALAHPYGANFRELIAVLRYRLRSDLWANFKYLSSTVGEELSTGYIGRDILVDYNLRTNDFGNETGQGDATDITLVRFGLTWMPLPNYYVDLSYTHRTASGGTQLDKTQYIGLGFRANVWEEDRDY